MRRIPTLGAVFALAAVLLPVSAPGAAITPAAAQEASAAAVTPFAGGGGATLLEVDAALAGNKIVDIGLTPAETSVDSSASARSKGRAANLDATLLGQLSLDGILSEASQSAPPDNQEPDEAVLLPLNLDPLLNLQVSTARTHARWPGDGECLPAGEPIVSSFSETAALDVLSIPQLGGSLVTVVNDAGGVTGTRSTITTETVEGQSGRALQSQSITQITAVTLFEGTPLELTVEVASAPTLTARASGSPGGASVDFNAPVVSISSPDASPIPDIPLLSLAPLDQLGGLVDQLTDALEDVVQTVVGDAGVADVNIILGEETLQTTVAADGTSAAGSAAAVVIEVKVLEALGADPLVDATIAVAPLEAAVTVPAGGIDCGGAGNGNPLDLHKDASQADVAPGSTFDYTVSVFNRGPCTLTDLVVTDVITGPGGSTYTAVPAPASRNGNTFTWRIDKLEPGATATFTIAVEVPSGVSSGRYRDELSANGKCGEVPVDRAVTLDLPSITDAFSGPCDLSRSNKSATHREVIAGQTFNYLVHVFNTGGEPCTETTVVDTLDDRLEFVACSDGCTHEGREVTWAGTSVPGGGGTTRSVTVRVRDDATGVLSNAATIDSPDAGGDPVKVVHTGPEITDQSVLLGPNPPGLGVTTGAAVRGSLPKTGGDLPGLLVFGLAGAGILGLMTRRRLRLR